VTHGEGVRSLGGLNFGDAAEARGRSSRGGVFSSLNPPRGREGHIVSSRSDDRISTKQTIRRKQIPEDFRQEAGGSEIPCRPRFFIGSP